MKTEEAKAKIIEILKEKQTATAQEINYSTKNKIAFVQIYSIMGGLIKLGAVKLNDNDGKKSYTILDAKKLDEVKSNEKESKAEVSEESKPEKTKVAASGKRDLTRYTFNKIEYNKGRLAHAIIAQAAKDKRLSLKGALELFDPEENVVPPYGLIKPIAEAKKLSKERQRFFIKPEEEIKLRDAVIAVSNQFTKERIEKVIAVARKELKYNIK